jgi:hypothetical protein
MTITIIIPRLPDISSWKINSIKLQTWIHFLKEKYSFCQCESLPRLPYFIWGFFCKGLGFDP